jgi:hypothetical protein
VQRPSPGSGSTCAGSGLARAVGCLAIARDLYQWVVGCGACSPRCGPPAGVRDERSTTPKPPTAGVAHRDDCAQQGWRRRVLSRRWASRCSRRRHLAAAPPASAMAASPATPWPCSLTPARSSPVAPPGTAHWPAPRAAGAGPDRQPGGARHQGLPGAGHGFLTAMPWRDSHLTAGGGQVRRHRLDDETAYGRLQ